MKNNKKVSKDFSGNCCLSQLPSNTFFKVVKKDGSLSKGIYFKSKDSWNRYSRKYDISKAEDVWGAGREMKGTTKVSTKFIY